MRETRFARLLVFRADVIPDVHGDDGRLVVFVDDQRETVVEHEFFKGDVDLGAGLGKQAVYENATCDENQQKSSGLHFGALRTEMHRTCDDTALPVLTKTTTESANEIGVGSLVEADFF